MNLGDADRPLQHCRPPSSGLLLHWCCIVDWSFQGLATTSQTGRLDRALYTLVIYGVRGFFEPSHQELGFPVFPTSTSASASAAQPPEDDNNV